MLFWFILRCSLWRGRCCFIYVAFRRACSARTRQVGSTGEQCSINAYNKSTVYLICIGINFRSQNQQNAACLTADAARFTPNDHQSAYSSSNSSSGAEFARVARACCTPRCNFRFGTCKKHLAAALNRRDCCSLLTQNGSVRTSSNLPLLQVYIFTHTVHHLHEICMCRCIRNLSRNMLGYFGLKGQGSDNELGRRVEKSERIKKSSTVESGAGAVTDSAWRNGHCCFQDARAR